MSGASDQASLIRAGRKVLETESAALTTLADRLDNNFAKAVEMMLSVKGRIVVCGMGKSGHVARKIAATLSSTGAPSQFVHPAEASHGDLGMVTQDDLVLVLSNSGETPELSDIIAYTRRYSIPMIGVASRPECTLLKQADIALLLPNAPEACSVGMAPTTSTTMTMALGDALAVAMMQNRSFTPDNFRDFHPGGRLGAKLASVGDLMHKEDAIPTVKYNTPMTDALLVITQKGFGIAGVLSENGDLVGVITDGDLRRHMVGLLDRVAEDVMTPNPKTVYADALASEAMGIMNEMKITTLLVVEPDSDTYPVGILHLHDCLRAGLG